MRGVRGDGRGGIMDDGVVAGNGAGGSGSGDASDGGLGFAATGFGFGAIPRLVLKRENGLVPSG